MDPEKYMKEEKHENFTLRNKLDNFYLFDYKFF